MRITATSTAVGAELDDVDLSDLDDQTFGAILEAFNQYGVLFFRDQSLSPEQHITFAERFGPININRFFHPVADHPQIAEVLKEPDQTQNIGGGWHTDHSYDVEPARCSILYAHEVPDCGGDTLFAGMGAAFEALSPDFKAMLRTLQAEHSSRHVFGAAALADRGEIGERIGNPEAATQDVVHPVVIAHPETGQELLYVNPGFTRRIHGWSDAESEALLQFLYTHAMSPVFHTRFHWQPGSLAMWDNRATWHYALNDYHGQRRYLHRITVEGVPLRAAAA
ncbi:MAG: TauD/TfdA dioxygenase family protein [Pseudomonadales bacterium]